MSEARCALCGARRLRAAFAAERAGTAYTSYHCADCQLYQTRGSLPAVSPDYVDLAPADLDAEHVFIQTAHKRAAFDQWAALVARHGGFRAAPDNRLIEIGCGVGGFLDYAAGLGLETWGFDASAAQVAAAAARHERVTVATGVADYLARQGAAGQRFALAAMWDVLEHLRDPFTVLGELRAAMAPGGLLYVAVPSGLTIPAKLRLAALTGRAPDLIPWEHVFYHSPKSLRRLFAAAGWEVRALGGVATYRRAWSAREALRRAAHALLRPTPFAFQLYALASPAADA